MTAPGEAQGGQAVPLETGDVVRVAQDVARFAGEVGVVFDEEGGFDQPYRVSLPGHLWPLAFARDELERAR